MNITELKSILRKATPLLILFVGVPIVSHVAWKSWPTSTFNITIINKTVIDEDYQEHKSIFWLLNYKKFLNELGEVYDKSSHYFGFFPDGSESYGKAQGIESLDPKEIADLASNSDLIFYTDTYGVFENDFNEENRLLDPFSPKIYGGLSREDLNLISQSIENDKTIVTEFNVMASPTDRVIRAEFENLMQLKWTGWIGRYYAESDTSAGGVIPDWFVEEYLKQNNGEWVPEGPGIIFVNEDGRMFILQQGVDFKNQTPLIRTQAINKHGFDLPEIVPYADWFDVVLLQRSYEVISYYDINPTPSGALKLREYGLPRFFPAAVVNNAESGQMYYLAGDFSDMYEPLGSEEFIGLPILWRGIHVLTNYNDRQSFFWNYYYPLMSQIISKTQVRNNAD